MKASVLKTSVALSLKHDYAALKKLENKTFKFDGTVPNECVEPMYRSHIKALENANDYLSQFKDDEEITGDQIYKYFAIVNERG